jgi:hypothetical protein
MIAFSITFLKKQRRNEQSLIELSERRLKRNLNSPLFTTGLIFDLAFCSCILTPLTVFYWISTWDILYLYIYNDSTLLSCAITLTASYLILLICYIAQEKLQYFHNDITSKNGVHSKKSALIRLAYSYIILWAYIGQWRGLWDVYNCYSTKIWFVYTLGVSLVGLLLYRFFLKRSFAWYIKAAPFYIKPKKNYNYFFMQGNIISCKVNIFICRLILKC